MIFFFFVFFLIRTFLDNNVEAEINQNFKT